MTESERLRYVEPNPLDGGGLHGSRCALATSHWRTKLIDWPVVQLRAREFEGLQRFQRGDFTFAQILEPN
jgi:hypothetical protein